MSSGFCMTSNLRGAWTFSQGHRRTLKTASGWLGMSGWFFLQILYVGGQLASTAAIRTTPPSYDTICESSPRDLLKCRHEPQMVQCVLQIRRQIRIHDRSPEKGSVAFKFQDRLSRFLTAVPTSTSYVCLLEARFSPTQSERTSSHL